MTCIEDRPKKLLATAERERGGGEAGRGIPNVGSTTVAEEPTGMDAWRLKVVAAALLHRAYLKIKIFSFFFLSFSWGT